MADRSASPSVLPRRPFSVQSSSVLLSEVGLFCAICEEAVLLSLNGLCAQENSSYLTKDEVPLHFMRFKVISCFCCRFFMNSWNQVGV